MTWHPLGISGIPKHIIVDDELHDLLVQLPANVLLEVFLDTCHSGAGIRAMDLLPDRKPRWMTPPSYEAFKMVDGRRSRELYESLLEKGVVHHILWARAAEAQFFFVLTTKVRNDIFLQVAFIDL